jgi:hypothetical protein
MKKGIEKMREYRKIKKSMNRFYDRKDISKEE